MSWLQIVLMIIGLLKNLQNAKDKEAFVNCDAAQQIGGASIVEWLWENREEILAFVLRLIEMFSKSEDDKVALTKQVLGE